MQRYSPWAVSSKPPKKRYNNYMCWKTNEGYLTKSFWLFCIFFPLSCSLFFLIRWCFVLVNSAICNVIAASFTCSTCIVFTMRNYLFHKTTMWWPSIPHSRNKTKQMSNRKNPTSVRNTIKIVCSSLSLSPWSVGCKENIFNDCSNLHRNII